MSLEALLIVNPRAGRMKIRNSLFKITEKLCTAGIIPTTVFTMYPKHAQELAANASHYDMIICTGGDGTLNEVISGAVSLGLDKPIGYIPLGSTNDFAKSLGIAEGVDAALDNILNGSPCGIDVGSFNGHYFTDVAFYGIFSKTAYDTPQDKKNALGFLAYILEGIKDLPSIRSIHLDVETETQCFTGNYLVCAVSNSKTLGGLVNLNESSVKIDDGLFELLLVEEPRNAVQLHEYIRAVRTGDLSCEGISFLRTSAIKITSENIDPWTLDGEKEPWGGETQIKVIPNAVKLLLK
jgi:YegS/Rv2252/BmrU family lipid kinase